MHFVCECDVLYRSMRCIFLNGRSKRKQFYQFYWFEFANAGLLRFYTSSNSLIQGVNTENWFLRFQERLWDLWLVKSKLIARERWNGSLEVALIIMSHNWIMAINRAVCRRVNVRILAWITYHPGCVTKKTATDGSQFVNNSIAQGRAAQIMFAFWVTQTFVLILNQNSWYTLWITIMTNNVTQKLCFTWFG